MNFGRQALRFRGGLGQADSGKGGNRMDRGCEAGIVGAVLHLLVMVEVIDLTTVVAMLN
jgi:hypothetical protein